MSQHTPGPWTVTRVSKSTILKDLYVSASPERIARVVVPDTAKSIEEYEANARLIAAAPDLLAALKAFSDYVRDEQGATDGAVTYSTTAVNHWAFLARSAIAKATGEQT